MEINLIIDSEILTPNELGSITGRIHKAHQITWLRAEGWKYALNAAGNPIVGRWYARMKLSGVELSESFGLHMRNEPDFSKAR